MMREEENEKKTEGDNTFLYNVFQSLRCQDEREFRLINLPHSKSVIRDFIDFYTCGVSCFSM